MAGRRIALTGQSASHEAHELEDDSLSTSEAEEQDEMMRARHEILEDHNRQLTLQLQTLKSLLQKQVQILFFCLFSFFCLYIFFFLNTGP